MCIGLTGLNLCLVATVVVITATFMEVRSAATRTLPHRFRKSQRQKRPALQPHALHADSIGA